jgi:hypothetical protein
MAGAERAQRAVPQHAELGQRSELGKDGDTLCRSTHDANRKSADASVPVLPKLSAMPQPPRRCAKIGTVPNVFREHGAWSATLIVPRAWPFFPGGWLGQSERSEQCPSTQNWGSAPSLGKTGHPVPVNA